MHALPATLPRYLPPSDAYGWLRSRKIFFYRGLSHPHAGSAPCLGVSENSPQSGDDRPQSARARARRVRRKASEAGQTTRGSQPGAPLIFLHSILISVTMSHCDLPSLPACSTSFLSTGRFSRSSAAAPEREGATVRVKDEGRQKYIRHRGRATSFPNNNQAGKQGRLASE